MDDLRINIEELTGLGFNCSQIMLMLSQEMRNLKNPELIRALDGLAGGMWAQKTCGTLTGGCCLLASYGAKGSPGEHPKFPYKEITKNFVLWFENRFGSTECKDLVGLDNKSRFEYCPTIIEESFKKCMEMLVAMNIDVYE